jgi:hypothetical protein
MLLFVHPKSNQKDGGNGRSVFLVYGFCGRRGPMFILKDADLENKFSESESFKIMLHSVQPAKPEHSN